MTDRTQQFPRPADLPPSNHYATNKLGVLSLEYRFLYPLSTISQKFLADANAAAAKARAQRVALYDHVATVLSLPWWVMACLHHMECDANPLGGIDNGDPWAKPTVHVPSGRGPYLSFAAEAIDALQLYQDPANWGVHFAGKNWSDPGWAFWFLESWNGFGARLSRGGATTPPNACPYLYNGVEVAGVPLFEKGKDTSDYNFDPNATSAQVGCMAFVKAIEAGSEKVFS